VAAFAGAVALGTHLAQPAAMPASILIFGRKQPHTRYHRRPRRYVRHKEVSVPYSDENMLAYRPAKTAASETLVQRAPAPAMTGKAPMASLVKLIVNLSLEVPTSWSKRCALAIAGDIRAAKMPDADNVLEVLKDGCNGVV
jgi:hypothetical protein